MSETSAPDIKQLKDRDLPPGKFPGEAKSDFRVFIDTKAYDEINKHAREDTDVEICGVLVGQWAKDEKGPFLSVVSSIRGESATNKLAEVTFTHDTWSKINARMDKDFVGKSIVGWYHTHPDFGIFLSDRDRFVHEHFFNEPGQVALVVDPIRNQEGLFIWSAGKAVPSPYYWIGDKLSITTNSDGEEKSTSKKKQSAKDSKGGGSKDSDEQEGDYSSTLNWITLALAILCALMLGWMLSNWAGGYERQKLVELILLDRVRLNRDLGNVTQNLQNALMPLASLQRSGKLSAPEVQVALGDAALGLNAAAQQLAVIQRQYALDTRELGQLATMFAQKQAELEAAMAPPSTQAAGSMSAAMSSPGVPGLPATQPTTEPALAPK